MVCISFLCFVAFLFSGKVSASRWTYEKQDQWPKQCLEGKQQSPIDLSPDISEGMNFPALLFRNYDEIYDANLKHNGHTVEVRLNINRIFPFVTGGGLLAAEYKLDSIHFHWDSEHTIEEKRFPLEVHLVHYDRANKDLNQALFSQQVVVLAVLFYESPDDDAEFDPLFDVIEQIHRDRLPVNSAFRIRLELDDFLPRDRAGYYRYRGSLTTPNCTEQVTWNVFTNPLPISTKQLRILRQLRNEVNVPITRNSREIQDLNGRKVFLKVSGVGSGADILTAKAIQVVLGCLLIFLFSNKF